MLPAVLSGTIFFYAGNTCDALRSSSCFCSLVASFMWLILACSRPPVIGRS
ncbi:hypothetical protein 2019_scaffold132_00058 [Bacteriophage sp.]|nr:hypothetical protein 2019_scaffold132_00058 [Bacteriophage sp.]